jgi:hypothetical protein
MSFGGRFRAERFMRRRLIADFVIEMPFAGQMFFGQMLPGKMLASKMFAGQVVDGRDVVEMFLVVQRERNFFVFGVQCFAGQQLNR